MTGDDGGAAGQVRRRGQRGGEVDAAGAGLETDDKRRAAMEPAVKITAMMLDAVMGLADDASTAGSAMNSVRDCAGWAEGRS